MVKVATREAKETTKEVREVKATKEGTREAREATREARVVTRVVREVTREVREAIREDRVATREDKGVTKEAREAKEATKEATIVSLRRIVHHSASAIDRRRLILFYDSLQLATVRLVVQSTTSPITLSREAADMVVVPSVCPSRKHLIVLGG